MPNPSFRNLVHQQVDLLQVGNPLEAFDRFFAKDGMMYANAELFAASARAVAPKTSTVHFCRDYHQWV